MFKMIRQGVEKFHLIRPRLPGPPILFGYGNQDNINSTVLAVYPTPVGSKLKFRKGRQSCQFGLPFKSVEANLPRFLP